MRTSPPKDGKRQGIRLIQDQEVRAPCKHWNRTHGGAGLLGIPEQFSAVHHSFEALSPIESGPNHSSIRSQHGAVAKPRFTRSSAGLHLFEPPARSLDESPRLSGGFCEGQTANLPDPAVGDVFQASVKSNHLYRNSCWETAFTDIKAVVHLAHGFSKCPPCHARKMTRCHIELARLDCHQRRTGSKAPVRRTSEHWTPTEKLDRRPAKADAEAPQTTSKPLAQSIWSFCARNALITAVYASSCSWRR